MWILSDSWTDWWYHTVQNLSCEYLHVTHTSMETSPWLMKGCKPYTAFCLWSLIRDGDLFCVTTSVTRDLGFCSLNQRNASFSHLLWQAWHIEDLFSHRSQQADNWETSDNQRLYKVINTPLSMRKSSIFRSLSVHSSISLSISTSYGMQ
jgi:hypothetical protein